MKNLPRQIMSSHAQIMPAMSHPRRLAGRSPHLRPATTPGLHQLSPGASKTTETSSAEPNPEYKRWIARDQAVLGYLLSSLTREVLMSVATLTSSADV